MRIPLTSPRVPVVEDESVTGLDIQHRLEAAGFEVVGPMMTVDSALQAAEKAHFDAAVLDANLNGRNASPVACALSDKRVPFAVLSGFSREYLPLALSNAPLIAKPFEAARLVELPWRLCRTPNGDRTYSVRSAR